MEVVVEDDGVRFVVVVDDVLLVEPSVMFLSIPEGRLSGDTCPPRMGGHLAAATGSSSFFSIKDSSFLSSKVRLARSLYNFVTILSPFSSVSLSKSLSVFQLDSKMISEDGSYSLLVSPIFPCPFHV